MNYKNILLFVPFMLVCTISVHAMDDSIDEAVSLLIAKNNQQNEAIQSTQEAEKNRIFNKAVKEIDTLIIRYEGQNPFDLEVLTKIYNDFLHVEDLIENNLSDTQKKDLIQYLSQKIHGNNTNELLENLSDKSLTYAANYLFEQAHLLKEEKHAQEMAYLKSFADKCNKNRIVDDPIVYILDPTKDPIIKTPKELDDLIKRETKKNLWFYSSNPATQKAILVSVGAAACTGIAGGCYYLYKKYWKKEKGNVPNKPVIIHVKKRNNLHKNIAY